MHPSRFLHRVTSLLLATAVAALGLAYAPSASADITTFSTSIVSALGRATYTWTAPAPAAQVTLKFVSTTSGAEWVFGLSSDVQSTATGTVIFDPKSMVKSDCTFCVVSKVSGPTTYLPNGVYTTSMSFLNALGDTTTSNTGSLTTALFAMPAALTPASDTAAGATQLALSATAPMTVLPGVSPYTDSARFIVTGKDACAGKVTTAVLANPIRDVAATLSITYTDPPAFTSSVALRSSGGDALVRGCSYDVSFLYQSALRLSPLPSNAENAPFVTTTSTNIRIPTVPDAPTIDRSSAGDGSASVSFTSPSDNGGSAITSYTVTSSPGGITASGSTSPITVPGLTNGTRYTFTVTATNAVGTSTPSSASSPVSPAAPSGGSEGGSTAGAGGASDQTTQPIMSTPVPSAPTPTVGGVAPDPLGAIVSSSRPAHGEASRTINGIPETVSVGKGSTTVTVSGAGGSLTVLSQGIGGSTLPIDRGHTLQLQSGGTVTIAGRGLRPGSDARAYIMSTPLQIGAIPVDQFGSIRGTLQVPSSLPAGWHTLQINGYAPDGSVVSTDLSVTARALPSTPQAAARVLFARNSSALTAQARRDLQSLVRDVSVTNVVSGIVSGLVRDTGATRQDVSLAKARATAVATYLRALGLRVPTTVTVRSATTRNVPASRAALIELRADSSRA